MQCIPEAVGKCFPEPLDFIEQLFYNKNREGILCIM